MKQIIGFLYLKTGAGHISGAKALAEKLTELYPEEVECTLKNGFESNMLIAKLFFEKGYVAFYQLTGMKYILDILKKILAPFFIPSLVRFIKKNKISKIVCTHEILITLAREAINRVNPAIPLISVVMDPFTAHPIWFYEKKYRTYSFFK